MTTEITNISQLLAKIEETNPELRDVKPGTIFMRDRIDSSENFYKVLRLEIDTESDSEHPRNIFMDYGDTVTNWDKFEENAWNEYPIQVTQEFLDTMHYAGNYFDNPELLTKEDEGE